MMISVPFSLPWVQLCHFSASTHTSKMQAPVFWESVPLIHALWLHPFIFKEIYLLSFHFFWKISSLKFLLFVFGLDSIKFEYAPDFERQKEKVGDVCQGTVPSFFFISFPYQDVRGAQYSSEIQRNFSRTRQWGGLCLLVCLWLITIVICFWWREGDFWSSWSQSHTELPRHAMLGVSFLPRSRNQSPV